VVDFRYHLVSIIAVFLALATGIVVGTTALNGALVDDLRGRVDTQAGQKRDLEGRVQELQGRAEEDRRFEDALATPLLAGSLPGRRVAVVSLPGVPGAVRDRVVTALRDAGADVVVRLRITERYLDPAAGPALTDFVARTRVGATPTAGPDSTLEQASAALAGALVGAGSAPATGGTGVLQEFVDAQLGVVEGSGEEPATLAVVLAGDPPAAPEDDRAVPAGLALSEALDDRAGTVVAGTRASAERGLVAAVRSNPAGEEVSSVDSVELPRGLLITVRALGLEVRGGHGHWGTGPGSEAPLPTTGP
jgi:hypothetical protein